MAVTLKGYTANYLGLSTDAKPTEADDNAIFRELDTGKRYYFTGAAWAEIPSSGGGGGGDVTSVNGKTGAVTLTASDVGAYTTAETDALLEDKQSETLSASVKIGAEIETTVEGAIGEVAAIIPVTAAVSNKLSTAADTAKEDITATANSEDIALTDAADARVHDLRIYGKTENGHSVGENGLTVTACGKNLFNINGNVNMRHQPYKDGDVWYSNGWVQDSVNRNTVSNNVLNAYYNASAEWGNGQVIDVEEGKTYTISYIVTSFGTGSTNACVRADIEPSGAQSSMNAFMLGSKYTSTLNQKDKFTVTIPNGITQILVAFYANSGRNALLTDIQVEEGAVATEYEPYHGSIILVNTAKPYRGILKNIDMGDLNWNYSASGSDGASYPRFVSSIPPDVVVNSGMQEYISCSSRYTPNMLSVFNDMYTVDRTVSMGSSGAIFVIDHAYTNPAEFKAAVTGITLTYPSYCDEIDLADGVAITRLDGNGDVLATPVTTPLTTAEKAAFAEFRTFDGNTNVTATDNPFMALNYVKSTDNGKALADVDNKSTVRMAMIAAPYDDTATYAVGNYCTYGDRLWKCNTAIGTAEPFTAAHWTATTVMEEI